MSKLVIRVVGEQIAVRGVVRPRTRMTRGDVLVGITAADEHTYELPMWERDVRELNTPTQELARILVERLALGEVCDQYREQGEASLATPIADAVIQACAWEKAP